MFISFSVAEIYYFDKAITNLFIQFSWSQKLKWSNSKRMIQKDMQR